MRIKRSRVDGRAEQMADRMLRKTAKPVKEDTPVDAPFVNRSNQPSYYPTGTLPVVSTAGSGMGHTRGEWSWTIKSVNIGELESYGLPKDIPPYAQIPGTLKANIIQRGDWDHWEFSMGQHKRFHNFEPGVPHVVSHHTEPIVLTHLDSRPIICQDYHQIERECARVGAQVLR